MQSRLAAGAAAGRRRGRARAEPGAKAAQTLRHQGFERSSGTGHERRTSVRGCRRTTCAATRGAGVYVHGEGSHADHDIELHPGRTAVDMKTTLQKIALDVMPQQHDGIPVAGIRSNGAHHE